MLNQPAAVCPRCGIEHRNYQRARRHVLCVDCRSYGTGWAEQARREVVALAREPRCRRGHKLTPGNVYARPDGRGRECLTCRMDRRRGAA